MSKPHETPLQTQAAPSQTTPLETAHLQNKVQQKEPSQNAEKSRNEALDEVDINSLDTGEVHLGSLHTLPALRYLIAILAILFSGFQVYQGLTAGLDQLVFRPIHLSWVMVLIFLSKPLYSGGYALGRGLGLSIDGLLIGILLYCGALIARFDYDDLDYMFSGLSAQHFWAGVVLVILLFEATRRIMGLTMVVIACVFVAYALFGDKLPASIASAGFSTSELVASLVYSTDGVFGSPLGIAAGVVFIYVLFGAFLQETGAGQFFIDCAFALTGKYRGGPAKASVIASAALGSISGSAIANTVTTGAITIPMMKRLGYRADQAAGIEAAASTGGQIMPPVMGAGAFVMAQFTGISYSTILLVSIIPAMLYFLCTLLYVHFMACRLGLSGMDKITPFKIVFKRGWFFLLSLILITTLLLKGYSPVYTGIMGCGFTLLITGLAALWQKELQFSWRMIVAGLQEGALAALSITVACASAGIVVGVVGKTGIALQFTQFLLTLSGGMLFFTLVFIALAALVLGMGLPVTAAYIVLTVLAVPTLVNEFGVHLLVANLFIFWLSQTSNVTPPVALAAFAGAAIAKTSPMRAAWQALKLAQGFFLIPLMMIYTPLIFTETTTWLQYGFAILTTLGIILAFAVFAEGWLFARVSIALRLVYLVLALGLIYPHDIYRLLLLMLLGGLLFWGFIQRPSQQTDSA